MFMSPVSDPSVHADVPREDMFFSFERGKKEKRPMDEARNKLFFKGKLQQENMSSAKFTRPSLAPPESLTFMRRKRILCLISGAASEYAYERSFDFGDSILSEDTLAAFQDSTPVPRCL